MFNKLAVVLALAGISVAAVGSSSLAFVERNERDEFSARFRCEFRKRDKHRVRCDAFVGLCNKFGDVSVGPERCRSELRLDCSNGFDFFGNRDVRVDQRRSDLVIKAKDGDDFVRVEIKDLFRSANELNRERDEYRATLEIQNDVELRARGECELLPNPNPTTTATVSASADPS